MNYLNISMKYINEARKEKFKLYDNNNSIQDINKMHILNIAAEMQNDLRKQQYINSYGLQQLNDLLSNLTEQDYKFINVLTEEFNDERNYNILNKYYIEHYNKDLKRVAGIYIPSKSEYQQETDFFNTFISNNINAFSTLKERKQSENIKNLFHKIYIITM